MKGNGCFMPLKLVDKYTHGFVRESELSDIWPQVEAAANQLHSGTGAGNDFIGWLDLPENYDREEFSRIKKAAEKIKSDSDVLIVIGIGGSYLGARAAIEFINSPYYNNLKKDTPEIYFVGNSISGTALSEVISLCEGKDVSVNVISKSGTTTEPAIAFRIFRELLEKKYGKEGTKGRIYCTTDRSRGTLKKLADEQGYESFVVPDNVGGRYSVLTAVGLLPIAVSGANIDEMMRGAADARRKFADCDIDKNDCYRYAAYRNVFYRKGMKVEMLAAYEPRFTMMAEWFKQLYGESEGKDNKGLFPASAIFSTDLHSLGQYIQDGVRMLFETVVWINGEDSITIKKEEENGDGLNFLAGKNMSYVNRKAFEGTILAHNDGGVPNLVLELEKADEYEFGYMVYFFEKACAISGYLLGVNPFDQPGVEGYKKNMFALLGKPGFEQRREELLKRIGE